MSNRSLRQDVIDELDFDPSVDSSHIGVAAENGVVTLTGHVKSYADKLTAEQAAKRVRGVRAVVEELEVTRSEHIRDEEIASRVAQIFRWGSAFAGYDVQAEVAKGWVTLNGELEWQTQRQAAEDTVRRLHGVVGITNNIFLKRHLPAEDIQRKIEVALGRSFLVESRDIQIFMEGKGKVVVEGKVKNWSEHDAVEQIAWSVPGVTAVEDHLTFA